MYARGFSALSVLTVTAMMLVGSSSARPAGSDAVVPTPEFLMAALRNQEVLRGSSLEVVYDTTAGKGDRYSSLRVTYVQTPDVLYSEDVNPGVESVKASYDRQTRQQRKLYTALRQLPEGAKSYMGEVRGTLGAPFDTQNFVETARYQIHEGPLCDVIGRGTVGGIQDPVDGQLCWRVTVHSTKAAIKEYIVWVDAEIGFCPRRINVEWKESSAPQVISFRDYREISPGVWFPMEHVVEHLKPDGTLRVTSRIVSANVGRTIPREELLVTFPPGTMVYESGK